MDIQNARVYTAGAYVRVDRLYVFALGLRLHEGRIPVYRLGGHRQESESGWQCAAREVYEEASLRITALAPPATYEADGDRLDADLAQIRWEYAAHEEPVPLLVVRYGRAAGVLLSVMYLAQADELPSPASEVKGLLLLREADVHRLCCEPLTLEQYLGSGGRAILNGAFDTSRVLEPFAQLQLLSRILRARVASP